MGYQPPCLVPRLHVLDMGDHYVYHILWNRRPKLLRCYSPAVFRRSFYSSVKHLSDGLHSNISKFCQQEPSTIFLLP